jgi:hypothetical protein
VGQSESMSVRALFDPRGVAIVAVGMGGVVPSGPDGARCQRSCCPHCLRLAVPITCIESAGT